MSLISQKAKEDLNYYQVLELVQLSLQLLVDQVSLFQFLDNTEYDFISEYGVPIYDDIPAEELEEIFDDQLNLI